MAQADKKDPIRAYIEPSKGFNARVSRVRDLMGGTDRMREMGEKYLPKFEAEDPKQYSNRKKLNLLFNGLKKTVHDMTDRVFEKPVHFDKDVPSVFTEWAEDIDMAGNTLNMFAKDIMKEGMQAGIHYLMVTAPAKVEGETQADVIANNNRPYIVSLPVENLLGKKHKRIKNKLMLTQARILEWVEEDDGEFAVNTIEQVRVYDLMLDSEGNPSHVKVRIFREDKTDKKWKQWGEDSRIDMPVITIVPFYANRTGFFTGEPVLNELAEVNVTHWQSNSDQRNILRFCRLPILFGAGISTTEELVVSSSKMIKANDPKAVLKWVEHTGQAIKSGKEDLEHLEFMMETHGLQLLVQQSGPQTATGENRNDKKENSRLGSIADSLKAAFDQCFVWMGEFQNVEYQGNFVVHKDFMSGSISAPVLNTLLNAVNNRKISKDTFWSQLVRMGILPETFDPSLEEDKLELEVEDALITEFDDDDEEEDDDDG